VLATQSLLALLYYERNNQFLQMMKNIGFILFRREDMVSYLEPVKMSVCDGMPPGVIVQGAARGTCIEWDRVGRWHPSAMRGMDRARRRRRHVLVTLSATRCYLRQGCRS
jgi:hypothetical protein